MACLAISCILLMLYVLFDVGYFIRIAFVIAVGRLFQRKVKVLESTSTYGMVTTQDVDIFLRFMNNARYVRELDFARFHFYDRTGLYSEIVRRKGHALQGATTVRYRRIMPLLTVYRIDTKLIYWDEKSIYLEQQFVTPRDGFVRAVVLSRQNVVGTDARVMMRDLTHCDAPPPPPKDLELWLEAMDASRTRLRPEDASKND
ncbi:protein THEM6 [Schistocerca nitens]|uniref:protein THEM6 n=1 Tax=Schistocerca nitens TaxID=7011 RepID=UPI002117E457|nr:protein THEM6 [Schistocerca nitens]